MVVALSGGPDSIVLLDMLLRLKAGIEVLGSDVSEVRSVRGAEELGSPEPPLPTYPPAFPLGSIPIHIAHLDHKLRGRESTEDAEFVRVLAESLALPITVSSVDVRKAASRSDRGIEEIAREIRYNFLLAVANEAGCDRIAVGHTMTDQAETFLMRLIRGSGLRGLAAMRPVVPAHTFPELREQKAERRQKAEGGRQATGDSDQPSAFCLLPSVRIIRPLLCITREEVEVYCRERGLKFRTDSTNLSLDYTRNRVRSNVIPSLEAINPRLVESISRAAENMAADQDVLADLASTLLREARCTSDPWRDCAGAGMNAYSVRALLEQPVGLRRRMIIEAIRLMHGGEIGEESDADCGVSFEHVAAVEGLTVQESSGKHIELPGSIEAWREFDVLVLKRSGVKEAPYQVSITPERQYVEAGGFGFTIQRGVPVELLESIIEETLQEKELTGRDWMRVAIDDRTLPEETIVRPRNRGERAAVIGRRRTIKLKNLMIDHRIPSSRRATWPLLTTPDGAYIWSPGLPPALEFAAHKETESLAVVRASAICSLSGEPAT